jgi:hypothetical protein
MMYDLKHSQARQALRLARESLRRCEREFTRHLDPGDDHVKYIEAIRQAEQRVSDARAKLHDLDRM